VEAWKSFFVKYKLISSLFVFKTCSIALKLKFLSVFTRLYLLRFANTGLSHSFSFQAVETRSTEANRIAVIQCLDLTTAVHSNDVVWLCTAQRWIQVGRVAQRSWKRRQLRCDFTMFCMIEGKNSGKGTHSLEGTKVRVWLCFYGNCLDQCFSNFFIPSLPFHSRHVVFAPRPG